MTAALWNERVATENSQAASPGPGGPSNPSRKLRIGILACESFGPSLSQNGGRQQMYGHQLIGLLQPLSHLLLPIASLNF